MCFIGAGQVGRCYVVIDSTIILLIALIDMI